MVTGKGGPLLEVPRVRAYNDKKRQAKILVVNSYSGTPGCFKEKQIFRPFIDPARSGWASAPFQPGFLL